MKKNTLVYLAMSVVVFLTACSGALSHKEKTGGQKIATDIDLGDETLLVYQFKIKEEDSLKPAGQVKLYLSEDAVRSEMNMQVFGQTKTSMTMLAMTDKPDETILLNEKDKTYSKMNIEMSSGLKDKMDKMTKDSVVVVGQQKVNGYNCTHLNVITTYNISAAMAGIMGKEGGASSVTKYWLSKDIPGYENMSKMLQSRPKMMNGMNAEVYQYGVPVKQVNVESGKVNFVMELVKAEQKNIPDEKFEIPDGYKES